MEGRPLEENDLIERSRDGDISAFEQLVVAHQAVAMRVAYVVVRDRWEAEDVTQDAFIKAYRGLHRFQPSRPFRPWLLKIVRNEALNRVRGRKRQQELVLRTGSDPVSVGAAPSPEAAVVSDEERARLLSAIEGLPDRYRNVLVHRYLLELSEEDTATVLGIAPGTVKSRTARGLERLRRMLGDEL